MCACPAAALLNEMNSLKQETREQNLQLQHRLTQAQQRLQERESAMEEMEKEQQRQTEELRRQVEDLRLQLENTERQLKSNKHFLDVSLLVLGFLLGGVFCLLISTCWFVGLLLVNMLGLIHIQSRSDKIGKVGQ